MISYNDSSSDFCKERNQAMIRKILKSPLLKRIVCLLSMLGTTVALAQPPQFQVPQLPEGEGKQLVEIAC